MTFNADHAHVLLDALSATGHLTETASAEYDGDPANDPKLAPEGYAALRAEAASFLTTIIERDGL